MAPFATTSSYSAQTCIKSGYVTGSEHFVVKVAAGGHPMPRNTGNLQVYSQRTGELEYLLLDQGILTEHRTAAAGAVAARRCCGRDAVSCIGMVGTGVQARYQLRYLQYVTDCRKLLVWGRTVENVLTYKTEMEQLGWTVEIAKDPSELVIACELIVTTTSGREAIVPNHPQRRRPQHITCIGADAPGKQELDSQLVAQSDVLFADSLAQTQVRGEFQTVIGEGKVALSSIIEMGNYLAGEQADAGWTVFDSSGVAFQDCAVASLVGKLLAE